MSRFYGSVSGSAANEATRMGNANTGIGGHIRGWNVGVSVSGNADGDDDVFFIYATGGSNDATPRNYIGQIRLVDGVPTFIGRVV